MKEHVVAVELLACYWTLAGPLQDFFGDDTSPHGFRHRVEAAARAGYKGIGIKDNDIVKVASSCGYREMATILRANGIEHLEIEALFDWFTTGERREKSDRTLQVLLEAAAHLNPRHVKVVGDFVDPDSSIEPLVDQFGGLCEKFSAVSDVKVALEMIPMSNVKDLASALRIVRSARTGKAGLMLDIWHITRAGIPYTDLEHLPVEWVAAVELDDARAEVVGTLLEDSIYSRRLCGEGDFDIPRFLKSVHVMGYRGPFGVEIISKEQLALPLQEAADRSFQSVLKQFEMYAYRYGSNEL